MGTELTRLTSLIVACSMKVHSVLGSGYSKEVYKKYFALELEEKEITFIRDFELPFYDEERATNYKVDFLVEESVLVELVVCKQSLVAPVSDVNIEKVLFKGDLEAGLRLNFGKSRFSFERYHNSQLRVDGLIY